MSLIRIKNVLKRCVTCQENKEETEFYSRKRWNKNNPNYHLVAGWKFQKLRIGMDLFNQMLSTQQERCAICKRPCSELKKRLAVDHDHLTGLIRGLLCASCNIGLGCFKDNTEALLSAVAYLSKTTSKEAVNGH